MEIIHTGKNMAVDLSPFFLLEAAGDSEGDLDNYHHNMMVVMGMGSCHDNDEEDDAQSCSYESYDVWDDDGDNRIPSHINKVGRDNDECRSGTHKVTTVIHRYGKFHDDDDGRLMFRDNPKKGGLISESGYSREEECNNKCASEVMSTANSNSSRKSCIDSTEGKKMSEKERNRLFWETCLAS